ncbi:unnamed protein product [Paramecium pentaurelia]|uniref:Uncharacterized protein n=1 Tax=Paramecium pentaurelia TaxID=43138 RepID=A0A8S1U9P7_9CILI|nr:unnamed protein product [Paramecium pentaurelia]
MPVDWDYNMTIDEVLVAFENNNFSELDYRDLILSYHIILNENNNIQSTPQTNNDEQQTFLNTLSKQIQAQIDTSNKQLDNQFEETQSMFLQIEQQNIPQINESVNQAVIQSKKIQNLMQEQLCQTQRQLEKTDLSTDCLAKKCGIQELESEFMSLQQHINQYVQKFEELTDKFKQHKDKFEVEKKKTQSIQQSLMYNIQIILLNQQ